MKRILRIIAGIIAFGLVSYFAFIYYVPYSEGIRSGELIQTSSIVTSLMNGASGPKVTSISSSMRKR